MWPHLHLKMTRLGREEAYLAFARNQHLMRVRRHMGISLLTAGSVSGSGACQGAFQTMWGAVAPPPGLGAWPLPSVSGDWLPPVAYRSG